MTINKELTEMTLEELISIKNEISKIIKERYTEEASRSFLERFDNDPLTDFQKEVIDLVDNKGLSFKQVVTKVNSSYEGVKQAYSRGKANLEKRLKDIAIEESGKIECSLNDSISVLNLSARSEHYLHAGFGKIYVKNVIRYEDWRGNIREIPEYDKRDLTIKELLKLSDEDILKARGIGRRSLKEIKHRIDLIRLTDEEPDNTFIDLTIKYIPPYENKTEVNTND